MEVIPLDLYDQYIEDKTLRKGYKLYEEGKVLEIRKIDADHIASSVGEGREVYDLTLEIKEGNLTGYSCECNESKSGICPHLAATLIAREHAGLDVEEEPKGRKRKAKTTTEKESKPKAKRKKKKTVSAQLSDLAERIPESELREFVLREAEANETFQYHFTAHFSRYNPEDTKALYVNQYHKILAQYRGTGSSSMNKGPKMASAIKEIFVIIKDQYAKGNTRSAFLMTAALYFETLYYIEKVHWTYQDLMWTLARDIGDFIKEVVGEASQENQNTLFEALLEDVSSKKLLSGEKADLIHLLVTEFKSKEHRAQLLSATEKSLANLSDSSRADLIIVNADALWDAGEEEESLKVLKKNAGFDPVRVELIERYMDLSDYTAAYKLAEERVKEEKMKTSYFSHLHEWLEEVLVIAIRENNTPKIIDTGRTLLAGGYYGRRFSYHPLLKATVPANEWDDFVKSYVDEVTNNPPYRLDLEDRDRRIVEFFKLDQNWKALQAFIKENNSLQRFKRYALLLPEELRAPLYPQFAKDILQYASMKLYPSHYGYVADLVGLLKELGAEEEFNRVLAEIKARHRKKWSLMDLLNSL